MRLSALVLVATLVTACSSGGPSFGSPSSNEGPEAPPPNVVFASAPCSAADSYVVVDDGATRTRLALGRELVAGRRGAKSAFAELVVHEDGTRILHVEALAAGDGSLSLSAKLDAGAIEAHVVRDVRLELESPGKQLERDELVGRGDLVLTRFGGVGEVVEGVLGPVASTSAAGDAARVTVRLHVCRTNDWAVAI